MKLLLHICCAPCAVYPVNVIRSEGIYIMGFFYRSNIHPYQECLKRENSLKSYAHSIDLKVIYQKEYDLVGYLQNVVFRESKRCEYCYHDRLRTTALMAKHGKFDSFGTTLLFSKFQKHETIMTIGEAISQETRIPFFYQDFRKGWKEGLKTAKDLDLYRQQYCGCIYSEKERYCRSESGANE